MPTRRLLSFGVLYPLPLLLTHGQWAGRVPRSLSGCQSSWPFFERWSLHLVLHVKIASLVLNPFLPPVLSPMIISSLDFRWVVSDGWISGQYWASHPLVTSANLGLECGLALFQGGDWKIAGIVCPGGGYGTRPHVLGSFWWIWGRARQLLCFLDCNQQVLIRSYSGISLRLWVVYSFSMDAIFTKFIQQIFTEWLLCARHWALEEEWGAEKKERKRKNPAQHLSSFSVLQWRREHYSNNN